MSKLLRLAEAEQLCLPHLSTPREEKVALEGICGRVLAADIHSAMALPSFDHAAMDGYALAAAATLPAGSEFVARNSQAAGDPPSHSQGHPWEIMTGARLPEGLNAVVAIERTESLQAAADKMLQRRRLLDPVHAGQNVRLAGSDVAKGERLLLAGTLMDPAHIMLLAALGIGRVDVLTRPRVVIVCTGKELQEDLQQPLDPAHIYGSNGPFLRAALVAAGAQVLSSRCVDDNVPSYIEALQRAVHDGADLIISTGAVSMGRYDLVPEALRQFGAEILFHKLAIRPGKPVLAARLKEGPLVVALPGTPMAVAAGMRFLITPLLRAILRQPRETMLRAVLDTPQQPKGGIQHFLRAQLFQDPQGSIHALVPAQQQPFRIQPFANADAWVVLPENMGDCAAGTMVDVCSVHANGSPAIRLRSSPEHLENGRTTKS